MTYWTKKRKEETLPWVKDWKDPQDHIRFEKNVNKLNWTDWYWCHPSSFKLNYYGTSIIVLSFYSFIAYLTWFNILTLILTIFIGMTLKSIIKKVKNYENIKYYTYYDQFFREYK